ncbi:MAG: alpha/beta hydrolase [Hyphomicrobiales bacterium]|nr:alpha/beta hydrolase [Hyphomicrobiales bacterium]
MDFQVDGQTVFAATGGRPFEAGDDAVVLVHGAGMDHTVWSLQTRDLAHHGLHPLALDLPGHGRSGGGPAASIEDQAAWLLRFLDAAGLARARLAGHSMGALTVLQAAALAPERITGLALLGVAAGMPVHPDLLAAAEANDPLAAELIVGWAYGARGLVGDNPAPGLWMRGGGLRLLLRAAPGVLHRDLAICNAYATAVEAAAKVACPVLLLLGDGDMMTPPRNAAPLAEAMAGSRTRVLADCGHMMMSERPTETAEALRAFLAA